MIRYITPADTTEINKLYAQLYPSHGNAIDLTSASFSAEYCPFILEEDSKLKGFLIGVIISFGRTTEAYIEDLLVGEAHRNQKIASQLVEAFTKRCRQKSVEIILVATDFDTPEQNPTVFYERLGFRQYRHPWLIKYIGK